MTLFNINKLPIGRFRDADFAYQSSSIDGGRKTVTHEYPNSKNRYVEDLGGLEKKFSITAWTDDNLNYGSRNSLINALEKEGIGTLTHPHYGDIEVSLISYNVSDNIQELGISRFSIQFEKSTKNILPKQLKGNVGQVGTTKNSVFSRSKATFVSLYKTVNNNRAKFTSASKTLNQSARKIKSLASTIQGSSSTFSDFTTSVNTLISSANSLVQSPSILADNIEAAFNNLSVAYNSAEDLFDVTKGFFGFDERDRDASGNSQVNKDIKTNQDQINNIINAQSVALAYDSAANISYSNLEQLNIVSETLESGFALLPSTLEREIYDLLNNMRVEVNEIFSNLAISIPNVNDYTIINPVGINDLVYSLYGSLDLKETIKELNNFQDTSEISGTIKILTNV